MNSSGKGTILVGVDGSRGSIDALVWSKALGESIGTDVTAVMAWEHPTRSTSPGSEGRLLEPEEMDEEVLEALRKLTVEADCATVQSRVLRGSAREALERASTDPTVEMLVVGTRGLGPIRGMMLGSVSRALLFHCRRPLILVPQEASEPRFRHIVIGIDGSPISDDVTSWGAELCRDLEAAATIVWCVDPGAEHSAEFLDEVMTRSQVQLETDHCGAFRDLGVDHDAVALYGDARERIVETALEKQAGLIVIGQRGTGQFDGLGGTASFFVRHSPVPLAVIPHPSDL